MQTTYELAFHLDPTIEEANAMHIKEDIEKTITSNGGSISFSKAPEKIRLSYPIKKHPASYFGYMHFMLKDPESLREVREHIAPNPSIIRSLITKFDADLQKKEDVLRRMATEKRKSRAALHKAEAGKPAEPQVKEEDIEKQLEGVIEKL
ncbi:MAG: hypothetical protein A3B99_02020 [Candidatus Yanofskybacteria bacterium RIFCSPHIGHO2_02_FULL_44_12b]|uniref:Small ribosomal subunit protein bS6 n=2 Tax=Candidatus Yanofskyibacteriota TaxID=1752733 RepID=A0A1F8GPJ3_9BACT|nr:MAG: 30S ribosomal protein S6 [Candidatus Yanofskybacteria bacterium GW2011_GWA2_44_9]OGN05180.1 MAG: hypothetical protein A2659_04095 [Candidatus Yanofskybacteria bacterium RIFCSPHIGHO2_01_FULL_44_24]OGN15239.1 MAG: hypothetical protein A3B99_02020 [Candidatus Yanofskybacteria bacterium RIFCSPHIGHO2_02_FULL_44_12b]OGN26900.1 MAG: hypothetical protein A2925_01355 [Candidatus Yanofskybacteria bacterium RIFCSPLOWO2_01_FULL_44_22]